MMKVNRGTGKVKPPNSYDRSNYVKAMCHVWVRRFHPKMYTKFMSVAEEKFPKPAHAERKQRTTEISEAVDKVGKGD